MGSFCLPILSMLPSDKAMNGVKEHTQLELK
jgi:hypothetical protein